MKEEEIRNQVRIVLQELMQQYHPAYNVHGASNRFPYHDEDDMVMLPQDIDPESHYLVNFEEFSEYSDNDDLYGFPLDEFKKGIKVEKAKRDIFNILEIAQIVINKLQQNPQFYSDLGV